MGNNDAGREELMERSILFVDDEVHVLNSLRRAFADSGFETFFNSRADDAIATLNSQSIAMVVCDVRMPGTDGYELLKRVREQHPQIIRILLSGYSEKATMLRAISDGTANAYLTKPWDNDELHSYFNRIFDVYERLRDNRLLDFIYTIEELPVLSPFYRKIIEMMQKDEDFSVISKAIENEPGSAVRILQIVNSSFFGVSISSVHQAVVYLGLETVKNILLSAEIFESFRQKSTHRGYVEQLWNHSVLSNMIFHKLYEKVLGEKLTDDYATAGLLHNVGELVFINYLPGKYQEIMKAREALPGKSVTEIEIEIVGVAHTELGAYLLDWWNLPHFLLKACLYHHGPFSEDRRVYALMHISDVMAWRKLGQFSGLTLDEQSLEICKTDLDFIERQADLAAK